MSAPTIGEFFLAHQDLLQRILEAAKDCAGPDKTENTLGNFLARLTDEELAQALILADSTDMIMATVRNYFDTRCQDPAFRKFAYLYAASMLEVPSEN